MSPVFTTTPSRVSAWSAPTGAGKGVATERPACPLDAVNQGSRIDPRYDMQAFARAGVDRWWTRIPIREAPTRCAGIHSSSSKTRTRRTGGLRDEAPLYHDNFGPCPAGPLASAPMRRSERRHAAASSASARPGRRPTPGSRRGNLRRRTASSAGGRTVRRLGLDRRTAAGSGPSVATAERHSRRPPSAHRSPEGEARGRVRTTTNNPTPPVMTNCNDVGRGGPQTCPRYSQRRSPLLGGVGPSAPAILPRVPR